MNCVDGFVLPVRKGKLEEYLEIARKAGEIWREYGALEYIECVAADVEGLSQYPVPSPERYQH